MKKKPKYRIVAYRHRGFSEVVYFIQKRVWFRWVYIEEYCFGMARKMEFPSIESAERYIRDVLAFKSTTQVVKEIE